MTGPAVRCGDCPLGCDAPCVWCSEDLAEDLRPDRCGVRFALLGDGPTYVAYVTAEDPAAWRVGAAKRRIDALVGWGHPVAVVMPTGVRLVVPSGAVAVQVREEVEEKLGLCVEA